MCVGVCVSVNGNGNAPLTGKSSLLAAIKNNKLQSYVAFVAYFFLFPPNRQSIAVAFIYLYIYRKPTYTWVFLCWKFFATYWLGFLHFSFSAEGELFSTLCFCLRVIVWQDSQGQHAKGDSLSFSPPAHRESKFKLILF